MVQFKPFLRILRFLGLGGLFIAIIIKIWEKTQQPPGKQDPTPQENLNPADSTANLEIRAELANGKTVQIQMDISGIVEISKSDPIQTLETDSNKSGGDNLNLKPEPPVLDPFTEDQEGTSETWSPSAMF